MPRVLIRTLAISLGLSLVGILIVVLVLGDLSSLRQLGELDAPVLLQAGGLLLLHFAFGGLRLQVLVRLTGERTTFLSSVRAFILGLFAAALTPSGGGNAPGIAIAFQRDGVKPANAWSAAIYTTVLDLFFLGYAVPIAALLLWRADALPPALLVLAMVVSALCLGIWYGLASHVDRLEGIVKFVFSIRGIRRWRRAASLFVRKTAQAMMVMTRGSLTRHIQAHALSLAMHVSLYTIMHVFLAGLDGSGSFPIVVATVTLVTAVSHFVPTPGGSGYMEATLGYSLAQQISANAVTASVLAYRAFSFYAAIVLGAVLGGSLLLQPARESELAPPVVPPRSGTRHG